MNGSNYLRRKLESERKFGIFVDKVTENMRKNTAEQISVISKGVSRASNYPRCLATMNFDSCRKIYS